jgi:2'-5' RNA ligase
VYSLNVPVPSQVAALASDLARDLPQAQARERGQHTLVLKRLTGEDTYAHAESRVREVLREASPMAARVAGVEYFQRPATGAAPVVYLAVESQGLEALHDRLADAFDPVEGIEGDAYVPHVTVARGGSVEAAKRLADRSVESHEWTISRLLFWDGQYGERVSTVSLPR